MPETGNAWVNRVADLLEQAEARRSPMPTLDLLALDGSPEPDWLHLDTAYQIQDAVGARRATAGDRYVGYKVAITQRAKLESFKLRAPIVGRLRACESVPDGGTVDTAHLIAPRIEPEIAFVLDQPLQGQDCDAQQVLRATRHVQTAFEIIDSRYVPGRFHVFSAVADNVSTARHVLGPVLGHPDSLDLSTVGCELSIDRQPAGQGTGAQVLGNPVNSVVELVRDLARRGSSLPAGAVVLTGGLVEAKTVVAGNLVEARFMNGAASVSVQF